MGVLVGENYHTYPRSGLSQSTLQTMKHNHVNEIRRDVSRK